MWKAPEWKALPSHNASSCHPLSLPQVPREHDYLAVLHITPLRASRPLALRYLAQRVGRPLDSWVVLALSPEASGSADGGDMVAGSYCSDTSDLLGGLQKVRT